MVIYSIINHLYLLCSPVFSPEINGIGDEEGETVTVNVSVLADAPSVVPLGPSRVNVQKSKRSVQTSMNDKISIYYPMIVILNQNYKWNIGILPSEHFFTVHVIEVVEA